MSSALEIRGIKYVVSGDNAQFDAANARSAEGLRKLDRQVEQSKIQFLSFGRQGELTARQLQALGYQTTDIITQLASGQATWLVLLQQGGQLRDQFGGFANVFKAVAGALTLGRVATLGATAAFVSLAAGLTLGYQESVEFRKQMALSGNAAGLTAGRVDELATSLAKLGGTGKGNARDAVLELAKNGYVASGALESAGRAALAMQRLSGESIEEISKRFAGARESVVRWATEANKSYNYITPAQIEYIRTLEQQGRTQEALRVNFDALSQTLEARTVPALGLLERGWQLVKNAASGAWDSIKAIGRDDTLEQQLAKVRKRIADAEKSNNQFALLNVAGDRDREVDLARQIRRQLEAAGDAAQLAAANQREIEENSKAHQDALLRIAEAGTAKYLAQRQAAIDAEARLQEEAYRQFETTDPIKRREQLAATERARFAAEEQAIRSRIAIERGRKVEGSPAEIKLQEIARDVTLIGLETQLVNLTAKRAKYAAEFKSFRAGVPEERQVLVDAEKEFRNLERAQLQATNDAFNRGPANARSVAREWQQTNAELSASLIQDERERGAALIALDVQQQRRRLQIGLTTAEEFKALEDGLAEYTVLRQQQLTEQLKPEWQKRLELYGDSVRFQRASFDGFMDATTSAGEAAWRDMLLDGRDFAKQLKRVIEQELATIGWRKYLAKPFANLMEQLANYAATGLPALFGGANLSEVGPTVSTWAYHSGGTAGMPGTRRNVHPGVFLGARRYHGGGLAGDEVPAILQKGERILPRGASSASGQITQINHYNVPAGMSPAAYAAQLEGFRKQVRSDLFNDLSRPGRPLYAAVRG